MWLLAFVFNSSFLRHFFVLFRRPLQAVLSYSDAGEYAFTVLSENNSSVKHSELYTYFWKHF